MRAFSEPRVVFGFVLTLALTLQSCAPAFSPAFSPDSRRGYPNGPITVVVPYAAGTDADVAARGVAEFLSRDLGVSVSVRNVVGDSGSRGSQQARSAPADGYTLLLLDEQLILNQQLGITTYGPFEFEPIAQIVTAPAFIATDAGSSWTSIANLVDEAKARPDELSWAMTPASTQALAAYSFMSKAGVSLRPVRFESIDQVAEGLVNKQVQVGQTTYGSALQQLRQGRVRLLGVAWEKRGALSAAASTFKEQGIDLILSTNYGFAAPKGTPLAMRQTFEQALSRAAKDNALQQKIEVDQGFVVNFQPRDAYINRLKDSDTQIQSILQRSGRRFCPIWPFC